MKVPPDWVNHPSQLPDAPLTAQYPLETSVLHVKWILADVCNYRCEYCAYHDVLEHRVREFPTLEQVYKGIEHLVALNRPLDILFTGGEPTLHPNFLHILEALENVPSASFRFFTNGHHSIQWFQELSRFSKLSEVIVSFHPQYMKADKIEQLSKLPYRVRPCILMDVTRPDQVTRMVNACLDTNSSPNWHPTCVLLNKSEKWGSGPYPYTPEQLDDVWGTLSKFWDMYQSTPYIYNRVWRFDNVSVKVDKAVTFGANLRNLRGFWCALGFTSIKIDIEGYVFGGICYQSPRSRYSIFKRPPSGHMRVVRCNQPFCQCIWNEYVPKARTKEGLVI